MSKECNNCSGGLHGFCSPPCYCGCPPSIRKMDEWTEKAKAIICKGCGYKERLENERAGID